MINTEIRECYFMNDIETIEIYFDPSKENIDWSYRQKKETAKEKSNENNPKQKIDYSKITESASVFVRCEYCRMKIENSDYSNHLLQEHPVEYAVIQTKKSFQKNSHFKLTKSEKKLLNAAINTKIITKKNDKPNNIQVIDTPKTEIKKDKISETKNENFVQNKKEPSDKLFSKDLPKIDSIKCPLCNQMFSTDSKTFIEHLKNKHNKELYTAVYGDGNLIKCKNCRAVINGCHPLVVIKHITKSCYTEKKSIEKDVNTLLENFVFQGTKNTESKDNEYTKRGLEIQTRLQDLRIEIKQQGNIKLYRDNIRLELLSLKKEMTENPDSFNKRDNINIRLAQIEDYLDKLNKLDEKEKANDKQIVEKTSAKVPEKTNSEENKGASTNKKRMKVIWSHSLS